MVSILARGDLIILKRAFTLCRLEPYLTNLEPCVDTDRFHTGDFDGPMSPETDITEATCLVNRETETREGTTPIQHGNVGSCLGVLDGGSKVQLSRVKNQTLFRDFEGVRRIVRATVEHRRR